LTSITDASEYPLVLTAIAVDQNRDRTSRQISLTLLKRFVLHSWSISSEHYTRNEQLDFLTQEQKSQIRQAMLHLLLSPDHIIRDLAANIVPKMASADWPNDWPGFLEELSRVIEHSSNINEVISVIKVLRGTTTEII
jgi:importin-9